MARAIMRSAFAGDAANRSQGRATLTRGCERPRQEGQAGRRPACRRSVRPLVVSLVLAIGFARLAACSSPSGSPAAPSHVPQIGYLSPASGAGPWPPRQSLGQGLRELGYREGQNVDVVERWADGQADQLPALAAELVRLPVDLIVAEGTPAALAARDATATIPIVMAPSGDPETAGLVASLLRPGGNVTGVTDRSPRLWRERLERLQWQVVGLSRVAVLWNPADPEAQLSFQEIQSAAQALGLEVQSWPVNALDDVSRYLIAASSSSSDRPDGLLVVADPLLTGHRAEVTSLVADAGLPAMYPSQQWVDSGGLLAYGPDREELGQRAASYVLKVLNGASPGELPVEELTNRSLTVNPSAAQALGLTIRQTAKDFLERARSRASEEDFRGAVEDATLALNLNPRSPLAYQERGTYRSANGDQRGAIQDFNVALELYPEYAEAYYGRGLAYDRLLDTRASFEDYTRAIQANPKYTWAYLRRGNARYAQDLLGAIDDYTQALKIDPDYYVAYHNRGLAHADHGDGAQALEDFDNALRVKPDYAQTYVGRAAILASQGDVQAARGDLQQASTLFLEQGLLEPYQKVSRVLAIVDEFLGGGMSNYERVLEALTALRKEVA